MNIKLFETSIMLFSMVEIPLLTEVEEVTNFHMTLLNGAGVASSGILMISGLRKENVREVFKSSGSNSSSVFILSDSLSTLDKPSFTSISIVLGITAKPRLYFLGFCFLILTLISYGYLTKSRIGRCMKAFPGAPTVPLFGNILFILIARQKTLTTIAPLYLKKYGRTVKFWSFHKPYIMLAEASSIEKVAGSPIQIDKSVDYEQFHWIMGKGLVTGNGQKWTGDRKLLNPCFKFSNLDRFLESFNASSRIFTKGLENIMNRNKADTPIDLFPLLNRCTFDAIVWAVFGYYNSVQEGSATDLLNWTERVIKTMEVRITKPWLSFPIIDELFGVARAEKWLAIKLKEVLDSEIITRKRQLWNGNSEQKSPIILDVLLNSGKDNLEIMYQCITIIGAGFETIASAMHFTLYLLAINLDCQAKVHQELDALFGDEIDRNLTLGDMSRLTYLEMCIKESMRIYPPVPIVGRRISEDVKLDDGLIIPRGATVALMIHLLHQDPGVFPNSEKFDPDRFLPEACSKRNLYSYIPFSMGPRNCIGQKYAMIQMKTVLSQVLTRFQLSSNIQDFNLLYGSVLRPNKEIKIQLNRRRETR